MTETRDEIVSRAAKGLGVTPLSPQPWSSVERQALLELVGLAAEVRDQIARVADALENRGERS
jgi:hypothetical protein